MLKMFMDAALLYFNKKPQKILREQWRRRHRFIITCLRGIGVGKVKPQDSKI
jgi:hypothetical protein